MIILKQKRSQILSHREEVITKPYVDIVIPTLDNHGMLLGCLQSLFENSMPVLFRVLIVNNGQPGTLDSLIKEDGSIKVYDMGENKGWEGGINAVLSELDAEFVMLLNDDTHIPPNDPTWLQKMLSCFSDPNVGAVGPSSNFVMQKQNMFMGGLPRQINVPVLIGLCFLMKTKLFRELDGLGKDLPGGDDLDLSMRIEKRGLKLRCIREVFVFHHGGSTGRRVYGSYWDSELHQDRTNIELIRRNGLREFMRCRYGRHETVIPTKFEGLIQDAEGLFVTEHTIGDTVADIGCGDNKTQSNYIGVDVFPKGENIPTLGNRKSEADIVASVDGLPFKDGELDTLIARHILEHVVNTISNIREWGRTIRQGGRLIIATPDESRVKCIPLNPEHVHAFTTKSLTDLVLAALPDFKEIKSEAINNGMSIVGVYERK